MANALPPPTCHRLVGLRPRSWQGVFVGLALVMSGGCLRSTLTDAPLEVDVAPSDAEVAADKPADDANALPELERTLTTKVTRRDPETRLSTVEVVHGWYRQVGQEDQWTSPPGEYRWHHDGLSLLHKTHQDYPVALRQASKSEDKFIRTAAVIGLARLEGAAQAKAIAALARDTSLPVGVRRAAVETLASAAVLETEAELRTLLERFGPNDSGEYQEPLLYAEALAGLARHSAVDQDPLFTLALSATDLDVQFAALSLLGAAQGPKLPDEVEPLVKSPHARIRRAALAALVAGEHPSAVVHLRAATKDHDLHVRIGAIELLGQVKHHEAVLALHDLMHDEQERHREAAAVGLVAQQEWAAAERVAHDTSYRVRVALAAALATHGSRARVPLAKELVTDPSAMVQAKMCDSLAAWPREQAVPVLLEGAASKNMLTRKAAHQALLKHQVDCQGFNPGAPPPERSTKLAALRSKWQKEHPAGPAEATLAAGSDGQSHEEVARLVKQLQTPGDRSAQWIARKQLERMGKPLVAILDKLVLDQKLVIDEATYRDLIAQLSPAFQAIEQLRDPDVAQRRAAARTLAHEATLEPLPRLALERMSGIARTESDGLVWSDLLRAAGQTTDMVAHELALAALTQGEADIRRRACEYLAICGDKRQSEALAALVNDRDAVVARAAVVALGRCGPPRSRAGVHALLKHPDISRQVAAAKTLVQWHDARGSAALERLALAAAPATRRLAIATMAELEDIRYIEVLMKALEDQPSVQLTALAALPKVTGEDPLQQLEPAPVSAAEKARAWQDWHAKRR